MNSMKHVRWYIAGLLCLATIINYVDRQTWNVTAPVISNVIKEAFAPRDIAAVKAEARRTLSAAREYRGESKAALAGIVDREYSHQIMLLKTRQVPDESKVAQWPAYDRVRYEAVKKALDDRVKRLISIVMILFEFGYILGPTPLGWLLDRLGTRRGYVITMAVWSAAGIVTVFAWPIGGFIHKLLPMTVIPVVTGFAFCRFLLGVGEAGNWPAAIKTIGEWFPAQERSFAMGIFNSGSSVGAFVAPFVIALLINADKNIWQPPYVVVGLIGYLWIVIWLLLYNSPSKHPRLSKEEYAYIRAGQPVEDAAQAQQKLPWWEGLKYRQVRGVLLSRFCAENLWKFSMYWLPLYLTQARGVKLNTMFFVYVALPALTSELGNLVGGWLSSHFVKLGWTLNKARKGVMAPCGIIMMSAVLVPQVPFGWAMAIICLITFCYQAWSVNMQTIPADVVPQRALGATAGMAHITAGLAGLLTNTVTGLLSYKTAFAFLAAAATLAVIFLFVAVGRIDPARREQEALAT
jgi:ACS family hexuronate transporter-like MFS transporter